MPPKFSNRLSAIICALVLMFSSCTSQTPPTRQVAVTTPVPPASIPITETTISTPSFMGVIISDAVPQALRNQVENTDIPFSASMNLDVSQPGGENGIQFKWVYALVAPFPTVRDGVTSDELRSFWTDGGTPLLMEESTLRAFTAIWGEPAFGSVRNVTAEKLLDVTWSESAWAIVPFESLDPKWKVLTIDGQSPIRKNFDITKYPLAVDFTLRSDGTVDASSWTLSNYDPNKLTTVIMTGVTALVRATAVTMELKGSTYPGEKMRDIFREADIMHVSNEIPFFTGCPYPKPDAGALVFCSDPKYMDLITDVGTDVIELTGNHFADYGPNAMYETLDIYRANNIPYFGGGQDLQDSLKPALFEVNGNKIAFIGCNKPDVGRFPTATDYQPGAAPCDFEYLQQKINSLKAEGYVVISTFQWNESYDYKPNPQQVDDFRLMADSGASVVSGSQAHYAQLMEFHDDAFIHYGLGNLFFDQMGDQDWMPPGIRRLFFDRYVIHDGKLISIELITAMLEDYSRPRIMNEEERAGFLQEYFYYSGWADLTSTPTPTITPTLTPMSIPLLTGPTNLLPTNTPSP
ncbi:MAG TPA: CapA family protein [Anaerolineales bacterium]|nr:CapA family protein [Anaerolineales bacterium]